jgi:hypothetical protein
VWNDVLHDIRQKIRYRQYPYPTSSVFDTHIFVFVSENIRIRIRIRRYPYSNSNPNKNMKTNMISVISVRIRSGYIPKKNEDPQQSITFGDGNQGLVKGLGKISISPDHSISNVFLVDSLDYNLLSVSQLCKMGYNCLFTDLGVTVIRRSDDSITFKGVLEGQLYLVDFNENTAELNTCLIAKTNMGWLWHRRLAHVGMKNLHKLLKG